MIRIVRDYYIH